VITKNTIYGNWWGVTIQIGITGQPGAQPNLGNIENADTTDNGLNIIYGNIQGSNVYDLYNNTLDPIFAQNNDWRVYDSTLIEDHIFHNVDSSALGIVKFMPFSAQIPVELTSFIASVIGGKVVLNWITATELNNSGFEIQRLKDSNVEELQNWEAIGFVRGNGTTTEKSFYTFADQNPFVRTTYYRLKQIDFDGSYEYSNIVEVDFSLPIKFSLEQNYPNPFNPSTKIIWQSPVAGHQTLTVYDVLGNEIVKLVDEFKPAGSYEIDFNASKLSSGVYFYQIQAGTFVETKKMILIR
jgi:hypothetical protein